ncbi:hypothetical protein [Wenyingzhuangia sp. IMCC45574]
MKEILKEAEEYSNMSMSRMSYTDKVKASMLGKKIVLTINEFYKKSKDPQLMEVMKLVTAKKKKIEKRLQISI